MNINSNELTLVKKIDRHANSFPDNTVGNMQLLATIYDHTSSFKIIMDRSTHAEMNYLISEYKGFSRFAQLIEQMAKDIANGAIRASKYH
jgi:hypothetical protein